MKILLRSMIVGESVQEDPGLAFQNYLAFIDSGLGFTVSEDNVIWNYVKKFCQSHNHSPSAQTIRQHFASIQETTVLDRLELLLIEKPIYRGDFLHRLEERAEERRIVLVSDILSETHQILKVGREIKVGRDSKLLRGPHDAVRFMLDKSHDVVAPTTGARLSGEVTRDVEDAKKAYRAAKNDPNAGVGVLTGYKPLDESLKGAKAGQLWVQAAFTGHGKSTFSRNWAYNQAVMFSEVGGHSSLTISLEMPYLQVRTSMYAIHSLHPKFLDARMDLGIQKSERVTMGLSYEDIIDGKLEARKSKNHERFFEDVVLPDMDSGKYNEIFIEVADPDKADFTVADVQQKAELIYSKSPFSILFVDHAGLLAPRKKTGSQTEDTNSVMRDLKRLSMSFNRGKGIAVVALFQINRTGFREASKRDGIYDLTALSYANEAEKSADIVVTTWADDLYHKPQNQIQFQCLKSRDRTPFQPFSIRCEWHNHRIYNSDFSTLKDREANKEIGDSIDALAAKSGIDPDIMS